MTALGGPFLTTGGFFSTVSVPAAFFDPVTASIAARSGVEDEDGDFFGATAAAWSPGAAVGDLTGGGSGFLPKTSDAPATSASWTRPSRFVSGAAFSSVVCAPARATTVTLPFSFSLAP